MARAEGDIDRMTGQQTLMPTGCGRADLARSSTARLGIWANSAFPGGVRGMNRIARQRPGSNAIGRSTPNQTKPSTNVGEGGGGTGGSGTVVEEFASFVGSASAGGYITWNSSQPEPRSKQGLGTTILPTSAIIATIPGELRLGLSKLPPSTTVTIEIVRGGAVVGSPIVLNTDDF